MRIYTLAFSIVVHAGILAAVCIVPLIATDVLPEPPRTTAFVLVRPEPPPRVVVNRRPPSRTAAPAVVPAPIVEPDAIVDEPVIETPRDPFLIGGQIIGTGDGTPFGDPGAAGAIEPLPPPRPAPAPQPRAPIRIGGAIQPPQKMVHVAPIYPSIARAARKEGIVILSALIGDDGRVRDVTVLRSVPVLDAAAVDAVRQWEFTPTLLNGERVPVIMTVTVSFTLD